MAAITGVPVDTIDVPPGMAVAPKGHWARRSPGGRNVNWATSDAAAGSAEQSTFHSNPVATRPAGAMHRAIERAPEAVVTD